MSTADVGSALGYAASRAIEDGLLDDHLMQLHLAIQQRNRALRDPSKPPARHGGMEAHQLWVWMAGGAPPRWEIRGTGLVLDPEADAAHRARRARLAAEAET